jgi:hypothetical protein
MNLYGLRACGYIDLIMDIMTGLRSQHDGWAFDLHVEQTTSFSGSPLGFLFSVPAQSLHVASGPGGRPETFSSSDSVPDSGKEER